MKTQERNWTAMGRCKSRQRWWYYNTNLPERTNSNNPILDHWFDFRQQSGMWHSYIKFGDRSDLLLFLFFFVHSNFHLYRKLRQILWVIEIWIGKIVGRSLVGGGSMSSLRSLLLLLLKTTVVWFKLYISDRRGMDISTGLQRTSG